MQPNNDAQDSPAAGLSGLGKGSEFYISEDSVFDDVPETEIPLKPEADNAAATSLDVLCLDEQPFSRQINTKMFYEEQVCKQSIDLLQHLSQYSDLVIFVSGENGIGKTTVLQEYMERVPDSVFTCAIDGSTILKNDQLEKLVSKGFNFPDDYVDKHAFLESLAKQLQVIARKFSTIVLLVDNVHGMPESMIRYLKECSALQGEDGKNLLHMIVFGESAVSPLLEEVFEGSLKRQELSRYSLEDTNRYIKHRVSVAGMSEELVEEVFGTAHALNIHNLSGGLPSAINELANNRLRDVANKRAPSEKAKTIRRISRRQLFSMLLLALLASAAWFFQDELKILAQNIPQLPVLENSAVNQPQQKTTTVDPGIPAADVQNPAFADPQPDITKIPEKTTAPQVETELAAVEAPAQQTPEQIVSAPVQEKKAQEKKVQDKKAEANNVAEVSLKKTPPQKTTEEKSLQAEKTQARVAGAEQQREEKSASPVHEPALAGILTSQWVLSLSPENYTIQVNGSDRRQDILDFIGKHKLADYSGDVAMFQTSRNGADWFSLVVGQYPDLASAKKARADLQASIAKDAWIRRNKAVQADIQLVLNKASPHSLRQEQWLLSQDSNKYTLQLYGTSNESSMHRFIEKLPLTTGLAYFRTYKKGGQWFGLVYGVYTSRSSAREAADSLSGKLGKNAWIRKFSGVQKDINAQP